jgi:hypothetical protein
MSEMSTNRIHSRSPIVVMLTIGLLLVLAAQVGSIAAATDALGASSSGALQGEVRIHLEGKWIGPGKGQRGRFTIVGAISDRGRFAGGSGHVSVRTLSGAEGTIWIKVGSLGGPCQCNWRITKGTRAYAGLHGRGRDEGDGAAHEGGAVEYTMDGTVSK